MEPRIQYAQAQDGVSIAFWTLGDGEPAPHRSSGGKVIEAKAPMRTAYERRGMFR